MDINATLYWAPVVPNRAVHVQVFAIPVSVGVGVVVFLFFWAPRNSQPTIIR